MQSIYSRAFLQLFCAICIFHHIVFAYSTQSISSTIYLQLFYAAVRDSAVAGSPVACSPVGSCTGCLLNGQATKRAPVCSETTISARDPAPRQAGIVFAADRCSFAKFRSPFRSGKASFSLQTYAPSVSDFAPIFNFCSTSAAVWPGIFQRSTGLQRKRCFSGAKRVPEFSRRSTGLQRKR